MRRPASTSVQRPHFGAGPTPPSWTRTCALRQTSCTALVRRRPSQSVEGPEPGLTDDAAGLLACLPTSPPPRPRIPVLPRPPCQPSRQLQTCWWVTGETASHCLPACLPNGRTIRSCCMCHAAARALPWRLAPTAPNPPLVLNPPRAPAPVYQRYALHPSGRRAAAAATLAVGGEADFPPPPSRLPPTAPASSPSAHPHRPLNDSQQRLVDAHVSQCLELS